MALRGRFVLGMPMTTIEGAVPGPAAEIDLSPMAIARMLPSPSSGQPLSHVTVTRWVTRGLLTSDGERLKLPARRIGGRWCIRRRDLNQFLAALQPREVAHA